LAGNKFFVKHHGQDGVNPIPSLRTPSYRNAQWIANASML